MTDQSVIEPTATPVADSNVAQPATSPLDDFANETAAAAAPAEVQPAAAAPAAAAPKVSDDDVAAAPAANAAVSAVQQDITAGVKDFALAFSFVEQGIVKLGDAAKDELIALARKYL